MEFRLALKVPPWSENIDIRHNILLVGSCFTDHMSARLARYKWNILENPHGILFNPLSILHAIERYVSGQPYTSKDLFFHQHLYQSWHHHGKFSDTEPERALNTINESLKKGHEFLKTTDWLIITLGSAFVYELISNQEFNQQKEKMLVANCHKVCAASFLHRLATPEEIINALVRIVASVQSVQPQIKVIFTVSPVRHAREGLVGNNRSKGLLCYAIGRVIEQQRNTFYFPAYELVIDDLRDYRFFAEDMIHPNHAATEYVWKKFAAACINTASLEMIEHLQQIYQAFHHRSLHPDTPQHKAFLAKYLHVTQTFADRHPYIPLSKELAYFGGKE